MQTSAPVFKIGPTQIQLLDAIQQSIYLKKKLVACTLEFFIGTKVRVKDDFYTIESVLGSGLIGTVYKVVDLESKKNFCAETFTSKFCVLPTITTNRVRHFSTYRPRIKAFKGYPYSFNHQSLYAQGIL